MQTSPSFSVFFSLRYYVSQFPQKSSGLVSTPAETLYKANKRHKTEEKVNGNRKKVHFFEIS